MLKRWLLIPLCLAMLNITACDYASSPAKTLEKPSFARDGSPSIAQIRDTAKPATTEDGLTVKNISGLSANNKIAGPIGLTTDRLFSAPVSNPDDRFDRLEDAVQDLADKVSKMSPSIQRLMKVDEDLDNLTYQLENLVNEGKVIPQAKASPMAQSPPPSSQNTAYNSSAPSVAMIKDFRIADHTGKTRLVFETSQKPTVTETVSNAGRTVSIMIDHGSPPLNAVALAKKSSLISGITIQPQSGGTLVTLSLTRASAKIDGGHIPPGRNSPNHRTFIDLRR